MTFNELLKTKRNDKNLTQRKLAEKLNISYQNYQLWESGKFYPSNNNIIKICKIFNLDIIEIIEMIEKEKGN